MALRRGLPYGAVMATGGACATAGTCGLHWLSLLLWVLAIAISIWIASYGAWRYRADFRLGWPAWLMLGPAHEHTGIHTVPLGLAVIISGLVALGAGMQLAWWPVAAAIGLGLAWLATLAAVGRFVAASATHGLVLKTIDGSWFLVPAALLGTGKATATFAMNLPSSSMVLAVLALAASVLGWLAYWPIAVLACRRIHRFGLGPTRAPWWIGMGCAGLAAATLAQAAALEALPAPLHALLVSAMAMTATVAVVLFVPVAYVSLVFMLRTCRYQAKAAWPPTFSTAVFAMGCTQAASVLHSSAFHMLGLAASAATLLFWGATAAWNALFHGPAAPYRLLLVRRNRKQ